jgi:hypothetical protein
MEQSPPSNLAFLEIGAHKFAGLQITRCTPYVNSTHHVYFTEFGEIAITYIDIET